MKRGLLTLVALSLLAGLGGCAEAIYSRAGGSTIDNTYSVTGWRQRGGATTYVFAKAFKAPDGKTKVCAAYSPEQQDGFTRKYADIALGMAILHHDGDKLVQGMEFMNRLKDPRDSVGRPATCVVSGVDWQDRYGTGDLGIFIQ